MTAPRTRQMTVAEARDWLKKALTEEYRKLCIAYWREQNGDAFVRDVLTLSGGTK